MKQPQPAIGWLTLALGTQLASCSSGSPPEDSGRPTIKFGMLVEAGDSSDTQKQVGAALMAIHQINDQGGVQLGSETFDLELLAADHGADTQLAVTAVNKFAKEGVVALLGPPWSSLALGDEPDSSDGVVAAAKKHGMVMVSHSASASALSTLEDDGLFFRTLPSDSLQAQLTAEQFIEKGIRDAAILYRDDAYGSGLAKAFSDAFSELGGTVVADAPYPATGNATPSTYDFDRELDATFKDRPSAVLIVSFDEVFQISERIHIRGDLSAYGTAPPVFWGTDGMFSEDVLLNGSPDVISHLSGTSSWVDPSDSNYQRFKEWVIDYGLDITDNTTAPLYDATYLLALAIQKSNSADGDKFKTAIQGVSAKSDGDVVITPGQWKKAKAALLDHQDVNYEGASGPIELDTNGDPQVANYLLWRVVPRKSGGFEYDLSEVVRFGG